MANDYSRGSYTHSVDRTTVTVGAPSILVISTMLGSLAVPASTGGSSTVSSGSQQARLQQEEDPVLL
jgi:hypothetical protein